jgi:hypothetical protein
VTLEEVTPTGLTERSFIKGLLCVYSETKKAKKVDDTVVSIAANDYVIAKH